MHLRPGMMVTEATGGTAALVKGNAKRNATGCCLSLKNKVGLFIDERFWVGVPAFSCEFVGHAIVCCRVCPKVRGGNYI
jgi:hypothetical protein